VSYKKQKKGRYQQHGGDRHRPNIRVIGKDATPRNQLHKELDSGLLVYTIKVPHDFYLRIGSGEDKELIDESLIQAVLKGEDLWQMKSKVEMVDIRQHSTVQGNPVIPGSTLKGAIRFRLEQSFKVTSQVNACYVVRSFAPATRKSWRHKKAYGANQPRYSCRDTKRPCVVCNIFGMMGMRGKVFFTDAELIEGDIEQIDLLIRRGRLSHEEVIKPGSKFRCSIYFENLSKEELGLLFFVMNLDNKKPILLGHHKYAIQKSSTTSIKFGHVLFTLDEVVIYQGLGEEKVKDLDQYIHDKIQAMQKRYGSYIEKLKDWEVLPC